MREPAVPLEIRRAKRLSRADHARLFDWERDVYGVKSLGLRFSPPRWHFLVCADGELVSHCGVLKRRITVGDREIEVAGFGGLVTVPDARGKGLGRAAFAEARRFAEATLRCPFTLLLCRLELLPFFHALGSREVEAPIRIEQPAGPMEWPLAAAYSCLTSSEWPPGTIDVNGLPW